MSFAMFMRAAGKTPKEEGWLPGGIDPQSGEGWDQRAARLPVGTGLCKAAS